MKIRYKTGLPIVIIVCAAFILGTSALTGASVNTVTGAIAMLVGVGYLVRPQGELTETELTLFALFGPLKRHYPLAQLRVLDGRIYNGEKKVPLAAWVTNGDDYQAVIERLKARS